LIDISDSAAVLIVFAPAPGQLAIELVARDIAHGIYHFGYLFLLIFFRNAATNRDQQRAHKTVLKYA